MTQGRWRLVWPILAALLLPLIGAWFAYPGTHLPPGFGEFPPTFVNDAPPFVLWVFLLVAALALVVTAFLLRPGWFGFRPGPSPSPAAKARLPWWFWLGAVLTVFFWWLMWARVTPFGALVYYAFTPLWWGFILVLDGLTYRLRGGRSLLASRPWTVVLSALVSIGGWGVFEYFDYFALGNWYYPNADMPALSHAMVVFLFIVAYTTVWPAIFEWITLLEAFPAFVARYARGPRLALSSSLLLWGGLTLLAVVPFFPYPLFWALWVGPLAVITGALMRAGIWTPFTPMAEGDWSPVVLAALGSLFNGFFWELWNYGSAHPDPTLQTNPNYWVYDVPYVNVIHLWAEMPLLGYFGYLPFGLLVWVLYIWAGKVFGFDPSISLAPAATSPAGKGA